MVNSCRGHSCGQFTKDQSVWMKPTSGRERKCVTVYKRVIPYTATIVQLSGHNKVPTEMLLWLPFTCKIIIVYVKSEKQQHTCVPLQKHPVSQHQPPSASLIHPRTHTETKYAIFSNKCSNTCEYVLVGRFTFRPTLNRNCRHLKTSVRPTEGRIRHTHTSC